MLNPNAQKVVDALRSGDYEQTTSRLRRGDEMCCLGVACDVASTDVDGNWSAADEFTVGTQTEQYGLPSGVRDWLGFSSDVGSFRTYNERTNLADLNDIYGKTFAEIADVIESEPEGLFA